MRLILFSALFLGCVTFLSSQNKKDTLSFIVSGNCGMCEKIIESVQYEKGVVVSDWDKGTKEIVVVYKPHKIREEEIHKLHIRETTHSVKWVVSIYYLENFKQKIENQSDPKTPLNSVLMLL